MSENDYLSDKTFRIKLYNFIKASSHDARTTIIFK